MALTQKGRGGNAATPLRSTGWENLPEEVADHVHGFASEGVDQDRVVPIANPAIAGRRIGQAVVERIVDPVAAAVIVRPQPPTDLPGLIAPAERIEIEAKVEVRPMGAPPVLPIIAVVGAPPRVPRRIPVAWAAAGAERWLGGSVG